MPCQCEDFGPDPKDVRYQAARQRINDLTRHLCYLCGELLEDGLYEKYTTPKLKKWWDRHYSKDSARVEKKMTEYVAKLRQAQFDDLSVATLSERFIDVALKVHPVSRFHKKWFKSLADKVIQGECAKRQRKQEEAKLKRKAMAKLSEKAVLGIRDTI